MELSQLAQKGLASRGQPHIHLSPIDLVLLATDQAALFGPIDKPHRAVMVELHALGKLGDVGVLALGIALDGQHQLVLLGGDTRLAGRFFNRLEALFWDPTRRRHIEQSLSTELAQAMEIDIADYELLLDVPRPEKWEMDVWVTFANPPVGMGSLVTWVQATGLQPDDLARYEQHQRRIRVVVAERLRAPLLARRDDLLLPTLEKLVEM